MGQIGGLTRHLLAGRHAAGCQQRHGQLTGRRGVRGERMCACLSCPHYIVGLTMVFGLSWC